MNAAPALRPSDPARAVAVERKFLLLAALDAEIATKLQPAFRRIDFQVNLAPTLRHARKVLELSRFDLILIGFRPRPEAIAELNAMLEAIRKPRSPNVTSRAALLAAPEELAFARLCGERASVKALATSLGQLELQEEALNLLRSRARLSMRVMTHVVMRLGPGKTTQLACQTYDLSRTGFFVLSQSRFPIGTPVIFTLNLPDGGDGIRGEAEVVRHADDGGRARAEGMGLRFVRFAADGERRLATFLSRRLG